MTEAEAQALAAKLGWEPPNHNDLPGSIPKGAWDHWRAFVEIAERAIDWHPVNAAEWRAAHATDWSPDRQATSNDQNLLLIQHVWHGFPDPPEWALYVMDSAARTARCLGCFDIWPSSWREAGN